MEEKENEEVENEEEEVKEEEEKEGKEGKEEHEEEEEGKIIIDACKISHPNEISALFAIIFAPPALF